MCGANGARAERESHQRPCDVGHHRQPRSEWVDRIDYDVDPGCLKVRIDPSIWLGISVLLMLSHRRGQQILDIVEFVKESDRPGALAFRLSRGIVSVKAGNDVLNKRLR